ncbi:MAG: hypothetical protein ACMUHY_07920, partial [Thermoplasmatota archaeon]
MSSVAIDIDIANNGHKYTFLLGFILITCIADNMRLEPLQFGHIGLNCILIFVVLPVFSLYGVFDAAAQGLWEKQIGSGGEL